MNTVKLLICEEANPLLTSAVSQSGKSILRLDVAARSGHAAVVREQFQQMGIGGCNGIAGGADAFRLPSRGLHIDAMTVLIGAGVMDTDEALITAVSFDNEAVLKLLLHQQARKPSDGVAYVNARDRKGATPSCVLLALAVALPELFGFWRRRRHDVNH